MYIQSITTPQGTQYVLTDCNGRIYGIYSNVDAARIALHCKKHG